MTRSTTVSPWYQLADLVGVPRDTTHPDIVAAVAEALEEVADAPPVTNLDRARVVVVDVDVHAQLVADARHGREASARAAHAERERVVNAAVTRGAITAGRAAAWRDSLERDPGGLDALTALPDNLAVPVTPRGHDHAPINPGQEDGWFPTVRPANAVGPPA